MSIFCSNLSRKIWLVLVFLSLPAAAQAHRVGSHGFAGGLGHPFSGIDHLLAMVAVGIIATQMDEGVAWRLPLVFVGSMVLGGFLGLRGAAFPSVETGIALSVLLLGVGVAMPCRFPVGLAFFAVVFFGLFHGFAHGVEVPCLAPPMAYVTGFLISTTVLHVTGVEIGIIARKARWTAFVLRYAGAAMGVMGLTFLLY